MSSSYKCTYIDGIASSEALDTSCESVSIKGLDCSSLVGGAFNWEHRQETPDQIIGKILKCKKIFSEEDCEDDRQLMYWNHCKIPFLYVMGRLFDDKKESSKEVAALFLDDHQHPHETPMVGFSIEGSKINKEGMTVTHSLARKVTITGNPANKTCIAKMIPAKKERSQDDLESIFKSEDFVEIDLKKSVEDLEKAAKLSVAGPKGTVLGTTSAGHEIHSHAKVGDYTHFSAKDHHEAMNAHFNASQNATDPKIKQFHTDKAKLHAGRRDTLQRLADTRKQQLTEARSSRTKTTVGVSGNINEAGSNKKLFDPKLSGNAKPEMKKTLTAGSGMAAPSQLTGGAALAKEDILSNTVAGDRIKRMAGYKQRGDSLGETIARDGAKQSHKEKLDRIKQQPKPNLTKSKWLVRAEEDYSAWSKKEEFRNFMKSKLPDLTLTEIDAIGKSMILNKSLKAENSLESLVKNEIFSAEHAKIVFSKDSENEPNE